MRPSLQTMILCILVRGALACASPCDEAPYDRDREHLWNRLHRSLIDWTDPTDGSWHRHLLEGESHARVLRAFDEFLEKRAADLITDPMKRLSLQRDLWAVFDLTFRQGGKAIELETQRRALRERSARVIGALALSEAELSQLPDTLTTGLPLLASALFDEKGPWVRIGGDPPLAVRHHQAVEGRSHFHVLLRIGERRETTLEYLKKLNAEERSFPTRGTLPDGSVLALVRRALAIDREGRIRSTPVIEGIQIRPKSLAEVAEFRLADGGLAAVDAGEEGIPLLLGNELSSRHALPRRQARPLLGMCAACHHGPEANQVHSFSRLASLKNADDPEPLKTLSMERELDVTTRWKESTEEWKALREFLDSLRKR